MKPRKIKDISAPLRKKGFVEKTSGHHAQYYLHVDGKKTHIKTYLSHGAGSTEYGPSLMKEVKKQLGFKEDRDAERFLDCPMKADEYVALLRQQGDL